MAQVSRFLPLIWWPQADPTSFLPPSSAFQIAERLFGTSTRPVWTAVGETDLLYEGQLIEIQVKAVALQKRSSSVVND